MPLNHYTKFSTLSSWYDSSDKGISWSAMWKNVLGQDGVMVSCTSTEICIEMRKVKKFKIHF